MTPNALARIILPYFGSLPEHFDLWLESCCLNQRYHWLVLTDDPRSAWKTPANVQIERMTMADMEGRIRERVGVCPTPLEPYKLCDFKVTYGLLFEEYLEGYPHWGFCDADMVFGDLKRLHVSARLEGGGALQAQGHMAVYPNTEAGRRYFQLQGPGVDYREVLSCPQMLAFDEWRGVPALLEHHGIPFSHSFEYVDITPGLPRFQLMHHRDNVRHQTFAWEDGHIYRYRVLEGNRVVRDEFAYMHMQKRPMPVHGVTRGDNFYLTPHGIVPKLTPAQPTAMEVRRLSRPRLKRLVRHTLRQWTRWMRPACKPGKQLPKPSHA